MSYNDGYERRDEVLLGPPHITHLHGFEAPPDPTWRVEEIVRDGYLSLVAAQAGTGKSFLALYLSFCVALGLAFFGRRTERGRVLYVDYEMDGDEQKRRLTRIAAGLGLTVHDERLKNHLYYYRPKDALATERGAKEIRDRVRFYGIDFVVVDSLTFSLGAADASAAKDVVPVLMGLQGLGVSGLVLDHFAKAAAGGNHALATPFGSTMKFAVARSVYNLSRADGGGLLLQPTKSNFGPKADPLCYEMEFEGESGPVRFVEVARTDASMSGSFRHMKSHDVTLLAVQEIHEQTGAPITQEQVVEWRSQQDDEKLAVGLGSVRNHFSALKKLEKIVPAGGEGYVPAQAAPPASTGPVEDYEDAEEECDDQEEYDDQDVLILDVDDLDDAGEPLLPVKQAA